MKKLSLLFALILFYSIGYGQVSSYTFAYSGGTYVPLSGGSPLIPPNTSIVGNGWVEQCYNVNLPFVYYFNGVGYSSVFINSNGHIAFGKPTSVTNPRPHTVNNGQSGAIMGYACGSTYAYTSGAGSLILGALVDNTNANPIMYGTIGSAPNRIFVVQWTNAYRSLAYWGTGAAAIENLSFQIRLKEGSNVAEMVYDASATNYSPGINATVGLSGASTADYNTVGGAAWNSVTNSTSGLTNIPFSATVSIPSGTTYDFTPSAGQMPTACSGTPSSPTALSTTGITCGSVGLSLAGIPLSTNLTYQWQRSATGLANSWTNISGATTASYTVASLGSTSYFQCLVACGAGTPVASSSVAVGYESACPAITSYQYCLPGGWPSAQIAQFQIAGTGCGGSTNFNSNNGGVSNGVSSYNYIVYNGTGGTPYNYVDYTNSLNRIKLQGSTSAASSFTATINNVSGNAGIYGVWIDLDDNGSFLDANEYVGNVSGVSGVATNFTLTIPANNFGIHRLRIRGAFSGAYSSSTITPTGALNYFGEAHDYTVEILPPTPVPTNSSPVCVTGTLSLTGATVSGSTYTWSGPLSYYATTTSTSQNYTVPTTGAGGVYTLNTTIKGANACSSATTTVTVNPQPSLSGASDNSPVCTNNTLNLSANSPANVTGYSWSGPVSITSPTSSTASVPSVQLSGAGTYSVTVNNGTGSGCSVTYMTTPTILQSPSLSVLSIPSATNPCAGQTSTVTVNSSSLASGTYQVTYNISGATTSTGLTAGLSMAAGAGTFTTPVLNNTGATTITITSFMNTALCSTTPSSGNTVNITVNPNPAAITGATTVCEGKTTALSDAGGGAWTSSNTSVATINVLGLVSASAAGTTVITYTLPATGCLTTNTVTVNPIPAAITPATSFAVCKGLTIALSDATTPGTWTSSNTSFATVDASGNVTGVAASGPVITYTRSNGCYTTAVVTVNPLPVAISGTQNVCAGLTTTLSDGTPFGLWTSANATVATIVSGTGVMSGLVAGTSDITYTLPTGCIATSVATVNPLPAAIGGVLSVCEGLTTTLSDTDPLGSWSTTATTILVSSGTGVVTGLFASNPVVTYTLPTGCTALATLTVDPLPAAITGTAKVCEGLSVTLNSASTGGTWMSDNTGVATVPSGSGAVTGVVAGTANITYTLPTGCLVSRNVTVNPLPAAITGGTNVCVGLTTTLSDATALGSWISSDILSATVGSASGVVSGLASGSPVITYKLPTGCINTTVITVNPLPSAISGTAIVCEGKITSLSDATPGGTWSAGNGNATVPSGSGDVTGVSAGNTDITYTLGTGCITSVNVLINPSPGPVAGTLNVCKGLTSLLGNTVSGGTWSISNTSIATVTGGTLSGLSPGTAFVTYMLGAGCKSTAVATVNALPATITGGKIVCEGLTTTLNSASVPGSWSSNNTTVASVVAGTGVVSGLLQGTSALTYTLSTGCLASVVVTVNPSPAPILGVMEVCKGLATPLSDAISGGTWSSSTGLATVSGTGVVTGVGAGTTIITYKLPKGCFETSVVTIDPLPAAITGTKQICQDLTVTLKDVTTPGTWSSGNTTVIVAPVTGDVTGAVVGTAMITYMLGTGCIATTMVTVNPVPTGITGAGAVCSGSSVTLGNTVAPGVWSSKSISLVSVDPVTGVVTGITPGNAVVTYTLPAGCSATKAVKVNALPVPYSVTGGGSFCVYDTGVHVYLSNSDTGVNYALYQSGSLYTTTLGNTLGIDYGLITAGGSYTVIGTNRNTGCFNDMPGVAVVTPIPLPSPIIGPSKVCVADNITLSHLTKGGTWNSSDASLATINPTTGVVKGVLTGILDITYTVPGGCRVSAPLTVIPLPDTITGTPVVCVGQSTTLHDATTGGTWSSSITGFATVDTIGVMKGIFRGNCIITYTAPNGCTALARATVNPLPEVIAGDANVCVGATAYLSDAYAGGTWKMGNTSVATVTTSGTLGAMTGVASGTSQVTYTLPTGCYITGMVTVDPQPKAGSISGPAEVCQSKSITLVDTTAGGSWHSKLGLVNISNTGVATGALSGKDTVLYSVTNVCGTASAKYAVTVNVCDFTAVDKVVNTSAELKVYPNPNDGVFTMNLLSDVNEPVAIVITNILGQKVKEMTAETNKPLGVQLDMPSGTYTLTGRTAHGIYTAKVTVSK